VDLGSAFFACGDEVSAESFAFLLFANFPTPDFVPVEKSTPGAQCAKKLFPKT